jgi:hypothetical protein
MRKVAGAAKLADHIRVTRAESGTGDHFGNDHARPITLRYLAEGTVSDSGHGGKEGAVSDNMPANAQCKGIT